MHRVNRRTWIVWVFLLFLLGGLGKFLYNYVTQAQDWASFQGSPHIYENGNLESGRITDRGGHILLQFQDGKKVYSTDEKTRISTLHWLGDRPQNIRSRLLDHYSAQMFSYDPVSGLYDHTQWKKEGQMMLTLSSHVQNVAMQAMGGRKGTVSVYNYKTGEILCAVSAPSFDPDNVPDITGNPKYEGVYLNRFVQATYPPGSIFKTVTAAVALDTVPDILSQAFACNGIYEYGIDRVTCERTHGNVDLKTALAYSCNCGFAQIAEKIGNANMQKYVDQFELTEPVKFDGITTARGNYDVSHAAPVELAWSCIGQYTDMVNPARFLTFMGAVAGGGRGAEPYMVSRVLSGDRVTYEAETTYGPQIMKPEVAQTLQELMHNNVRMIYGSGNFPGFEKVCAKSGTSELGGDKVSNAMFAGFVMDEAYPLAFMAVVENSGYGAANCVPILSRVLSACKQVMDS